MRFTKAPKIDRKTGLQVGWRYKFWVYNPNAKRNEPVPVTQLPGRGAAFVTDEEAQKYCDLKSAEENAVKIRIQKRREWRERFYDFTALLDQFAESQKEKAPNSWRNDVYWLESYVFHFFLNVKSSNNVNNWALLFDEFRSWLRSVKPLKYRKDKLAFNSMNKAIKALNLFLSFLARKGLCQEMAKCQVYPKHQLKRSTAADVVEEQEITAIYAALRDIRPVSAELFLILVRTGMRVNEALGITPIFVRQGKITGNKSKAIHAALEKYGLGNYDGYICLESQPALESIRGKDRRVPRKPLKGRKEIDARFFRFIPIHDKTAWRTIAIRVNQQAKCHRERKYGGDVRDYLLFDGMTASMFYGDLQKAYQRTKIPFRSPHKLRHTFLTWFYDVTNNDPFLAETVAGHKDRATMDLYSHAAEQRGREALGLQEIALIDVEE